MIMIKTYGSYSPESIRLLEYYFRKMRDDLTQDAGCTDRVNGCRLCEHRQLCLDLEQVTEHLGRMQV